MNKPSSEVSLDTLSPESAPPIQLDSENYPPEETDPTDKHAAVAGGEDGEPTEDMPAYQSPLGIYEGVTPEQQAMLMLQQEKTKSGIPEQIRGDVERALSAILDAPLTLPSSTELAELTDQDAVTDGDSAYGEIPKEYEGLSPRQIAIRMLDPEAGAKVTDLTGEIREQVETIIYVALEILEPAEVQIEQDETGASDKFDPHNEFPEIPAESGGISVESKAVEG
ncbi:hypothetical protein KJ742_05310 [Patescibacteria group bacterium]|nr:hypothetical protein [Patescibacteria group bacterium]MBU1683336.1 hypothetical protein [Patescibacteria group bacterium]MBU1934596.1 hypothetical protein [Patescibacteria group bacterium]